MATDINITNYVQNELTEEQLQTLVDNEAVPPNEVFMTPDEVITDLPNKADKDASNLTSENVIEWQDKLSEKIVDYTTTALTNSITISGLDLLADGGEYEIILMGNLRTDEASDATIIFNGSTSANYSESITNAAGGGTNPTVTTNINKQSSYCGLFGYYGAQVNLKLNQLSNNQVYYTSSSFGHYGTIYTRYVKGQKPLSGSLTSFTITLANANTRFQIGTKIFIFKRNILKGV